MMDLSSESIISIAIGLAGLFITFVGIGIAYLNMKLTRTRSLIYTLIILIQGISSTNLTCRLFPREHIPLGIRSEAKERNGSNLDKDFQGESIRKAGRIEMQNFRSRHGEDAEKESSLWNIRIPVLHNGY
ncbi:hypothetical protein B0O99DRAFT_595100 [Bisporella sp. PMI_857]|nr:hypothetical protein B0O99DRAFT_595100 [Bisporella sp. PMI_857]